MNVSGGAGGDECGKKGEEEMPVVSAIHRRRAEVGRMIQRRTRAKGAEGDSWAD